MVSACSSSVDHAKASDGIYGAKSCGGALPRWSPHGTEYGELAIHNALALTPKGLTWNSVPIDEATAMTYLKQVSDRTPAINIQVVFNPEVSCRAVQKTRVLVNGTLHCGRHEKCVEYSSSAFEAERALRAVN